MDVRPDNGNPVKITKMSKKYWHELPQQEIDRMIEEKTSLQFVVDNYSQPDWCTYPEALMGMMGCWSLTDLTAGGTREKVSETYCKDCECFKKK